MEIETVSSRVSGSFPFPKVSNSIQAAFPDVLSHPMMFALFRDANRSVIDLYFSFLTPASFSTSAISWLLSSQATIGHWLRKHLRSSSTAMRI
jgi:hypothetical protein